MKRLFIFHANCFDGFTAAWVGYMWCGEAEADFVPWQYGTPAPTNEFLAPYKEVYVVDFSFPRVELLRMKEAVPYLRVLDHHKTAKEDLEGLDFCTFDMDRSGAGITWDHFFPSVRPPLVDYVEDRDLWRFKLPDSKAVNARIGVAPKTFECWSDLSESMECGIGEVAHEGQIALLAMDHFVREMKEQARTGVLALDVKVPVGYDSLDASRIENVGLFGMPGVPIVNTPYLYTSEVIGALAERDVPFAVGWFQRQDGMYQYSLRSRGDRGDDVAKLAEKFGGGGHRNSAGFSVRERVDRYR